MPRFISPTFSWSEYKLKWHKKKNKEKSSPFKWSFEFSCWGTFQFTNKTIHELFTCMERNGWKFKADTFLGYKKYLDDKAQESEENMKSDHKVRTVDKHATIEHGNGTQFVKSNYSIIENENRIQ